jgi:hypothetical protein
VSTSAATHDPRGAGPVPVFGRSISRKKSFARFREGVIGYLLLFCALVSIATTVGILVVLFTEAIFAVPPNTAFFQDVSPSASF